MDEVDRKEQFKEYYLKSFEEKDKEKVKRPRGRPKNIVPKFKITKLDEPITITW
tara:strand:+ start:531 stop:692 length:162 start_codon:yes stop_codon:yes gene_type:complete